MIEYDLHIHSKYSFDSLMGPRVILKTAKRRGLDIIAVTDHGTIRGGLETGKMEGQLKSDVEVIVGAEITTDAGDVVGLFLNEEVQSRRIEEVIDEIRSQDGLVLLPHPLRGHNLQILKIFMHKVDLVELLSSRSPLTVEEMDQIRYFGRKLVGCSDAHFPNEIGLCRTLADSSYVRGSDFKKLLMESGTRVIVKGSFSSSYAQSCSMLIKHFKLRQYKRIPLQVLYTSYQIIKKL